MQNPDQNYPRHHVGEFVIDCFVLAPHPGISPGVAPTGEAFRYFPVRAMSRFWKFPSGAECFDRSFFEAYQGSVLLR